MNKAAHRIALSLAVAASTIVFGHPPKSSVLIASSDNAPPRADGESSGGGGIAGFPCPNPGAACCEGTATVGCEDAECCNLVCSIDPFCCDTLWDGICGSEAKQYCSYCGGTKPVPANDNCADAPTWSEGGKIHFSTIGATTDGPPIDHCMFFFGDPQVKQDIWFRIVAWETGNLHISVCDSDFDTRLVVYSTCGCPVSAVNDEVVCSDDGPDCGNGLQSEVTFFATQGECYTVRVGGFGTAQGTGTMLIEFVELCKVSCPVSAIPEFEPCGTESNSFCEPMPLCAGQSGDCCAAHASSGCDDPACESSICQADPFCCEIQWDSICAGEACSDAVCDCVIIDIFPLVIPCGAVMCGSLWAQDGERDLDEYQAKPSQNGLLKWSIKAQMAVESSIFWDCDQRIISTAQGACGNEVTAALVVEAGSIWWLRVRPTVFNDLPCGSGNNEYVATLTCDPCFTDTNNSGETDVDDLLVVINGWGSCANPPCASDLDFNNETNVDDLLYVVNNWGECP